MAIIRKYQGAKYNQFAPVRAMVVDAINPHEAHAARYVAHPNAARVWKGRV